MATSTLLFVDDEPLMIDLFRDYMTMRGYNVLTATDAETAIQLLSAADPHIDLVITDMTMPGMDGLEFAQRLLQTTPSLPVLLTTGHDRTNLEAHLPDNVVGIVSKPYQNRVLAERIREILEARPD